MAEDDSRASAQNSPGENVRRERVRQGLTQGELAAMAGCDRNTVSNIESGKSFSKRSVEPVARALKTTPEDLGFRFPKTLRPNELTQEQRDLIDEFLALPADDQADIRAVIDALRAKRKRRSK